MNTFDWLHTLDMEDPSEYNVVEISFKKGARKNFYLNPAHSNAITGDMVVVEAQSGYDLGRITLSGELVRLQMKKKNYQEEKLIYSVIRIANHRDLEKLEEARNIEHRALVRARVISRTLGLDMKIGDVEFQGDKRKATFYYTAEGRVDFRELVRMFAKEFHVKIEMRQIGSRQESARIGGIGSCGRELCCSTWLSNFNSVTTVAARYQNISINQTKLSGQCGRLKCCLNYELDMYMEALSKFPKNLDSLQTAAGKATLIKTDIFKGLMYFAINTERSRGPIVAIDRERVWEIKKMNQKGEKPESLVDPNAKRYDLPDQEDEIKFADVTGEIELPSIKKKRRPNYKGKGRKPNRNNKKRGPNPNNKKGNRPSQNKGKKGENKEGQKRDSKEQKPGAGKPKNSGNKNNKNRYKKKNNQNRNNNGNKPKNNKPNNTNKKDQ
jgi:cell fate regulator YaaT (PSP1 superfamily)